MESKERQQSEEQNNKKEIRLSDHFTYGRILRFVFPTIVMMITASVYSVVDGFFVSNYVGKVPFAAINLVTPILFILGSVGYMAGAGGSAIVGITLGEGNRELAEKYFTLITLFTGAVGLGLGFLGMMMVKPLAVFMGAEGQVLADCTIYGRINLLVLPFFMLSNMFQSFLITAQKPKLGLCMSTFSGLLNLFSGCGLHRLAALGAGRRSSGHCLVPIGRNPGRSLVFFPEQGQSLKIQKAGFRSRDPGQDLHQRVFGDGQHDRIFCHNDPL